MRHLAALAAAGLALACTTGTAGAQQQLKPGLWELQTQMRSDEMDKRLAAMPPEQRARLQAMLGQPGVAGSGGQGIRYCLSPEDAKRPPTDGPHERGDCKTDYTNRSGNRLTFKTVCSEPPSTADGEVVFEGPEAYTMKMHRIATVKGAERTMDVEMHAHFVAADCGDVKPARRPDRK